jgi:SPP1 family predicted phage head-tail adaptor
MAYRTPIGEMRKRILIQRQSDSGTASGETTQTPSDFRRAWARILPTAGGESWIAKELQELITCRINMRYQKGILPKMRAVWQGRIFNFVSVRDLEEMHEELEILAKEEIAE